MRIAGLVVLLNCVHATTWILHDPDPTMEKEFCNDGGAEWDCAKQNSNPGYVAPAGGADETVCLNWCVGYNFCSFDFSSYYSLSGNWRCCSRANTCASTGDGGTRWYRVYVDQNHLPSPPPSPPPPSASPPAPAQSPPSTLNDGARCGQGISGVCAVPLTCKCSSRRRIESKKNRHKGWADQGRRLFGGPAACLCQT